MQDESHPTTTASSFLQESNKQAICLVLLVVGELWTSKWTMSAYGMQKTERVDGMTSGNSHDALAKTSQNPRCEWISIVAAQWRKSGDEEEKSNRIQMVANGWMVSRSFLWTTSTYGMQKTERVYGMRSCNSHDVQAKTSQTPDSSGFQLLQHNGENLMMMMMMMKSTEFRWLQHEWQCPGISLCV